MANSAIASDCQLMLEKTRKYYNKNKEQLTTGNEFWEYTVFAEKFVRVFIKLNTMISHNATATIRVLATVAHTDNFFELANCDIISMQFLLEE